MKKLLTFTALATVLAVADANAAGFHLREQSAAAQGNAFAGATAGAENASYAYFNVAGLTRQKGTNLNLGGTYIAPEASAGNIKALNGQSGETGDMHNVVHSAIAPNGTITHQLNDEVTLGLGLNVPFGMITKHNSNWAGAAHGNTSKVTTVTTTPMLAWKINDNLSIGAGLPIEYIRARLTSANNTTVKGDTTDIGYQLGAMYELDEATRFGIGYRSEMKHKLKGKMSSDVPSPLMNQDIHADLDLPAMLSVGAYHDLNDKWSIMAEYQRVFWSSFDRLDFASESGNNVGTNPYISRVYENWRDTNFYAVGASYQIDNQWKARFGLAYDEAAVKASDRTPRIPDSNRIWYSAGLNYQYSDNLSFDMAFTYIDAKKAVVDTSSTKNAPSGNNVYAEYDNSVKMWGLSLNYKF